MSGYQTHCIGKRHFYPQMLHMGFDAIETYEAGQYLDASYVNDYREWLRERTNGAVWEHDHGVQSNSWYARPSHLPEELHNNTWVATRGQQFLRHRDPTRPFFLNLSFHRPHPPADTPGVFFDYYREREIPAPPVGGWARVNDVPPNNINAARGHLSERLLQNYARAYYAQIAHIDNQVGRFLTSLQEHSPAWVIFTSDHGEMLGDHHLFRKTYAYEGSARIPFIVCPPGTAKVHACDAPVVLEDIMPTVLDAAGLECPRAVDGRSVVPLLHSTPGEAGWRSYIHGEHSACYFPDSGMQYLTDGRRKYVWYTQTGCEQFFDLEADRQEVHELSGDPGRRDEIAHWRKRMIRELALRPQDGLSDGKQLIAGTSLPAVRPEL